MNVDIEEHLAEDAVPWTPQRIEAVRRRATEDERDHLEREQRGARWWAFMLVLLIGLIVAMNWPDGRGIRLGLLRDVGTFLIVSSHFVSNLGRRIEEDPEDGFPVVVYHKGYQLGSKVLLTLAVACVLLYSFLTDDGFGLVLFGAVVPAVWLLLAVRRSWKARAA